MPNIFKRPGTKNYYCRFQYAGKDYLFSTGTSKRKSAQEFLKAKQAEITHTDSIDDVLDRMLRLLDELPRKDQEKIRAEAARKIIQGQTTRLALSEAWNAWLDIPKKTGASTIRGYEAVWKRFVGWATKRDILFLHEVSEVDAQDYAADLWKSRVSTSTYNMHKRFLAGMFKQLKAKAGLVSNPWDGIASVEKELESRRNLTRSELEKVIGNATGNMQAMLMIGLFSALRLTDVVNLRKDSIKLKENMIELIPAKTKRKNKKIRIPIHTLLLPALKRLIKTVDGDYLFPLEREAHIKSRSELTKQIQKHFEACGIQTKEKPAGAHRQRAIVRVGFHSLRHSFVSLMAAGGAPQHVIQQIVGHGSPAMTEHYTHLDDEQKTAALTALPVKLLENN